MPTVSVIVPNYNHANFLALRLESILEQSFEDFELIFLDDASTDNSIEVFNRFSHDRRIRQFLNTENSGSPFVQWNRGMKLAVGDYIWIAESDDFSGRNFLEQLVKRLDDNPAVGVAYCHSWIVAGSGEKQKKLHSYEEVLGSARWSQDYIANGRDEVLNFLAIKNTIPNASGVLFRKSVLERGPMAPEDMKLCGDWMFWINLLQRSDIAYVAEPMNFFRQAHAASQRSLFSNMETDAFESLEIQKLVLAEFNPDPQARRRILRHHLWKWVSISVQETASRQWDKSIRDRFRSIYGNVGEGNWREIALINGYYYLVIPVKKSRLYRSTLAPWELRRYERKRAAGRLRASIGD